ncbi:anti-sigma factor [Jannaschia marina]|uniref:anti-sigma factor n=1 Tax=Jannaschia marina TaxID=2741674 RepID=UPI001F365B5B|nr:anti-sigma factor [Jannaschia marina]
MMDELAEDDDLTAAELALGLLEGDALSEARARVGREPAFARALVAWEARLSHMAQDLAAEDPPAAAKAALMARLFPEPAPVPLWRRAWPWQLASVAAIAVASLLFFTTGPTPQEGPLYTAEIAAEAGDFRVVALVDKSRDEVILTRTLGAAPEGRILQVWAHGPGEPAQSVGLWPAGESVRLPLPTEIAAVEGVLTLGVSEEPPGGSTTGSPSGRVFGTVEIPGVTAAR